MLGLMHSGPAQPTGPKSAYVFVQIKPLRDNERGIDYWQTFIRNISSLSGIIQFVVTGNHSSIKLFLGCERSSLAFVENMFYASYPESELIEISTTLPHTYEFAHYSKNSIFRDVASYSQGEGYKSPFHDILSVFNTVDGSSTLTLQLSLVFKQKQDFISLAYERSKKLLLGTDKKPNTDSPTDLLEPMSSLKGQVRAKISMGIQTPDLVSKSAIKDQISLLLRSFLSEGKIVIKSSPSSYIPFLRSQLSNFFHIPTLKHFSKALDYGVYRKLPYPYPLPTTHNTAQQEFTLVGTTDYRNDKIAFGMREEDKFRHIYIVGKTGTGKSTFLSNLISNDIANGKGIALLDPHGELVETVLEHIPSHRTNDVILFDIADSEFPIGFNLLQASSPEEKNRIVSGVVTTFQKLFAHSRGPRLEYILRNVLLTLVDYPNATLMHILRILTDKTFREEVLKYTTDTLLLKFWRDEYDRRDERQKQEAMGPITNKIGQFLSSNIVRNIFAQPKSKLNLREAMDNGKIILINLSKGKIGEDNAAMIGSLLVTKFQIDAMSRADTLSHQRRPFYLYIDEFQNFATDSFATILSEARKYKLSLIMANQYTSQLSETIRDAIFGNIGSIFSFTIGYDDAKLISSQFKEMVTTNDLISLPRFTAYSRMMIDGITSDPFSLKTMPLPSSLGSLEQTQKIIQQSRQRYAIPRLELEKLLNAWQKRTFSASEKIALRAKLEGQGISNSLIEKFMSSGEDDWNTRLAGQHSNTSHQHQTNDDQLTSQQVSSAPVEANIKDKPTPLSDSSSQVSSSPQTILQTIPSQKSETTSAFSIKDIVLGQEYQGYIKLQFNYGLFITVKGVEGLLHKGAIIAPEGVNRKKYFTPGDPIQVIAKDFKDIDGEQRVVWTMKG